MKRSRMLYLICIGVFFLALCCVVTVTIVKDVQQAEASESKGSSKLAIVWTSGDRDVALKTVFMYTNNAKKQGWFDQVRLIVWGPSSLLLSVDKELQEYLRKMQDNGVELQACIACSNMYGVTEKLHGLGIEVKGMGKPLTEMMKTGWVTMTF